MITTADGVSEIAKVHMQRLTFAKDIQRWSKTNKRLHDIGAIFSFY